MKSLSRVNENIKETLIIIIERTARGKGKDLTLFRAFLLDFHNIREGTVMNLKLKTFFWIVLINGALLAPSHALATAIANSGIVFSNLQITPASGTVSFLDPWQLEAFAEAQNSLGQFDQEFNSGTVPVSASATVLWASASGSAAQNFSDPLAVAARAASSDAIPGKITGAASSKGRGSLANGFIITNPTTGETQVDFSADIKGLLDVFTDQYGQLAETEIIFGLELDGKPILFADKLLSIGPNERQTLPVAETLSTSKPLQFNVPYGLFLEVDSESRVVNIPEPPAWLLLSLGLWAGFVSRRKKPMS
jgi:hypothetical protein